MDDERSPDVELERLKRQDESDAEESPEEGDVFEQGDSVETGSLSWQEKKNIALLYSVYMVHAIPMTFSWFTMPILLRQQLSYTLISTLLLSQMPYSVKVLWSPIVQSKYLPLLGRRKSWVVPCFFLGGLVIFWLAYHQDDLIHQMAAGGPGAISLFMISWLILQFLCSNIRIALDDWSVNLLSQANVHLASTTATFGEMSGAFFSFQIFLGLSSIGHPNAGAKGEEPSTKTFFLLTGTAFIVVSILVLFVKRDTSASLTNSAPNRSLSASYAVILRILKLPQVWVLISVHMTSMIGFQANDTIAILQLVKSGFTDLDVSALAAVALPFELTLGVLISRAFRHRSPLEIWRTLFPYRLAVALCTQLGVLLVTHYKTHHWRWFIAVVPYIASKGFEDMMYIALVAFHAQVADPTYGGIYLPLLATSLNIRYDTMGFIATKSIGYIDDRNPEGTSVAGISPQTNWIIDGYQIVNLCAVGIAVPVYWFFLLPATVYLEKTKREDWRVGALGEKTGGAYQVVRNRSRRGTMESGPAGR